MLARNSFQQTLLCPQISNKSPLQKFQEVYISTEQHELELPFSYGAEETSWIHRPFVVNCFTIYIHEKCYRLGTFSMWNVTWKKCHQSWHWCGVGKQSMYVCLGNICKCSVCNLKTQGRTVWTNTAGVIRLFPQLYTHIISRCSFQNIIKQFSI